MPKVLLIPLVLLSTGCTYLANRGQDFGDCWRGGLVAGMAGGAWVHAGPLLHEGLGSNENIFGLEAGWRYGYPQGHRSGDSVYPEEGYGLWMHQSQSSESGSAEEKHFCYAILPILFERGEGSYQWLHAFDLEAGAGAGLGLNFGFSPGEFLDFLLGWFGIDIAGDDTESGRQGRNYFRDRGRTSAPTKPKE